MNTKMKKFVLGALAISALFGGLFAIDGKGANASATTTCVNAVWSATLTGTVRPNGEPTEAWFEWGEDSSLPYQTPHQTFTSDSGYEQNLTPLAENTTYYYRAIVQNQYGTDQGNTKSFHTGQCATPLPTPHGYVPQCSDGIDNDRDGQTDYPADYFCTDPGDDDERDPVPTPTNPNTPTNPTVQGNIQAGNLSYQCLSNPFRIQLNWTSGVNANSNGLQKADVEPNNPSRFWGWLSTNDSQRSYTDSDVVQGTTYTYRVKYAPSVPSNEVVTNCGGNTPTPQAAGMIEGFKVHHVSSTDLRVFPQAIRVNVSGASSTSSTANPYHFPLAPGNYTVSADDIPGFTTMGYTLCVNSTSCHNTNNVTPGSSVNINVASGSSYDLWWHYTETTATPTPQAAGMIEGFKVHRVSSTDLRPFGAGNRVSVSGASSTSSTANPYHFPLAPGNYTVTADNIADFTIIGYTLCVNSISCHNNNPTASSSVNINVASGSSYDLWWHYRANDVTPTTCQTSGATNIGGALPCTFPPTTCQTSGATNIGGALPCTFPPTTCQTSGATNIGGALPCTFPPTTCQTSGATNIGGALPCTFPPTTCQDTTAINNGGTLPCKYTQAQPTVNISADKTSINTGESTTVRWTSTNSTSCTASAGRNGWTGSKTLVGSFPTGALPSETTYTITCYNSNNGLSATNSITVRVTADNDEGPDVTTRTATGVDSDSATLNGRVDGNGISTKAWFEYGTMRNRLNESTREKSYGSRSTSYDSGITSLRANTTYYFRAVAENSKDTVYGNILSFYTGDAYVPPTVQRPTVVLSADQTSLAYNRATTVRWYTTNATSCYASGGSVGWTGSKTVGSGSFYTGALKSSKTFSMICTGTGGSTDDSVTVIVRGQVLGTTTIVRTPTNALILLSSSVDRNQPIVATLDNTRPHPGDDINYTVSYQNVGTGSASNLVLRLDLPYEVDYISSNPNNPTRSGQTLIFNLGTLKAGGSGSVTVRVRVRSDILGGTVLNFPATLTYNDPSGYPQSVSTNVSATVWSDPLPINQNYNNQNYYNQDDTNKTLVGAGILGGSFLPGSLFEWLLLLILILVFIVLIKYIFNQPQPQRQTIISH